MNPLKQFSFFSRLFAGRHHTRVLATFSFVLACLFWAGLSVGSGIAPHLSTAAILAGFFVYALIEFFIHRYLHRGGESPNFYQQAHLDHHHAPRRGDGPHTFWFAPLLVSLPVGVLFEVNPLAAPLFFGVLFGYGCYNFIHHQAHLLPSDPDFLDIYPVDHLRRLHLIHHGAPQNWYRNYSVVLPVLDRIAGTLKEPV